MAGAPHDTTTGEQLRREIETLIERLRRRDPETLAQVERAVESYIAAFPEHLIGLRLMKDAHSPPTRGGEVVAFNANLTTDTPQEGP